jgi:peptidoglycan/LPS O-acetylase OafA/YrhL
MKTVTTRPRLSALDGIRGIAVLLVLLFHFAEYSRSYALRDPDWLRPVVRLFNIGSNAGWVGVQLFFVLSGFLITGILIDAREERDHYFRNFYARRALRILPVYACYLLFHLLILSRISLPVWADIQYMVHHQIWYWTFTTNVLFASAAGWHRLTSHLWTLSIEEQFYLIWPIVVLALPPRRLKTACWVFFGFGVLARIAMFADAIPARTDYLLTPTELDGLVVGAFLAVQLRANPTGLPFRQARVVFASALVTLVGLFLLRRGLSFEDRFVPLIGFPALAIVFGGLTWMGATSESVAAGILRHPALRFFGRYSYAIYLFHMPVIQLWSLPQREEAAMVSHGVAPFIAHSAYVIAVTIAITVLAMFSWRLIESPFLRIRPGSASRVAETPAAVGGGI